jgi:hypothetical protein
MKATYAGLVLGLTVASGFVASGNLSAQQQQAALPVAATSANSAAAAATASDTLFGKIKEESGNFVLIEAASKEHYVLDDQKAARRYKGRIVAVTGTVAPGTRTIHVQRIEVAA